MLTHHTKRVVIKEVVRAPSLDEFVSVGWVDFHLVVGLVEDLGGTAQRRHHILHGKMEKMGTTVKSLI